MQDIYDIYDDYDIYDIYRLYSTSLGTTDCIKGYMKKCGTPIQRELLDFILEQLVESVKQFCNDGEVKESK